jgi:hypothetical protein
MPDDWPDITVSYELPYLFVFWSQAEPAPFEVAALRRIDTALQGMDMTDLANLLKGEDGWRLGPFATEAETDAAAEQLRAAGLTIEKKWQ